MYKTRKITSFIMALVLCFAAALPALAITIVGEDNSGYDYFEYYSSGEWHDQITPHHTDTSGNVAYCIEHEHRKSLDFRYFSKEKCVLPAAQTPP